jgi:hypothetical protein
MKIFLAVILGLLTSITADCQGMLYDQQSTNIIEGGARWTDQPMGQSFTPSLSALQVVELSIAASDNNSGSTLYVNLRSNSITGPILASSVSAVIPYNFLGITNFMFSAIVPIAPGTQYYLEPVIQSGPLITSLVTDGSYSGGSAYLQGSAWTGHNLWFREGILVPEPSSAALSLTLAGFWIAFRRVGGKRNSPGQKPKPANS